MKNLRISKNFGSVLLLATLMSVSACKKHKKDQKDQFKDESCIPVVSTGRIAANTSGDQFAFRTTGGGHVTLNINTEKSTFRSIKITHEAYPGFNLELWGDTTVKGMVRTSANHESLNGKHIKDRIGTRRSIIFPDGAKLTLFAEGRKGPLLYVSVYDGAESHRINLTCNTLIKSSTAPAVARQLDEEEADGETGGFEITPTGLLFFNLYTEDTPGVKTGKRENLGEIFRSDPTRVNDYFDDSTRAST
ncbi:MAG: hypothetical protein ACOH2A_03790 [Sphingobacteriaceae bacterium]